MKVQQPVKLQSLLQTMQAEVLTDAGNADVSSCYLSDMLSDVLAHAEPVARSLTRGSRKRPAGLGLNAARRRVYFNPSQRSIARP